MLVSRWSGGRLSLSATFPKGYFFSLFLSSISAHILLAIPGAPLTPEPAVFSGFAPAPNHTVPSSTLGRKRSASGHRAVAIQEGDLMQGEWVSSDASLCVAASNLLLRSLKSVLVSGGESIADVLLWQMGKVLALLCSHPTRCRTRFFCCCCPEGLSPLPHTDCSLKCDKTPHNKLLSWKMQHAETGKSNWRMTLFKAICVSQAQPATQRPVTPQFCRLDFYILSPF